MTESMNREPDDDPTPEALLADVARWRDAQPPVPALDRLLDRRITVRRPRRRNRRLLQLGVAAACVATAAGVALAVTGGHNGDTGDGAGVRLVGKVQPISPGTITAQDIGKAQTAFGLDLLARRCKAAPTANDVLSPASAALALALLDAGAKGKTQAAIAGLLHLPGWSPTVVAALHQQHTALTALAQLKVSNHLYTQLGIHPRQQVLDDLATAEAADLHTLDFARHSRQATDVINARVSADTKGLIQALFDSPLDQSTTTVVTNAIYLNAAWTTPFPPANSSQFHTASGKTVMTPTLTNGLQDAPIRHADGWTSAVLPYAGGRLAAVVLLPPNTADNVTGTVCAAPTTDQLGALTTGAAVSGPVTMPKLDLTQTHQLTDDLAALGLPLSGDYSGFGTPGGISKIVQKTVLQVDENGTKAAAATGGAIATAGHLYAVIADRPYLLLIQDLATGTPLFLARINDPTSAG